MPLSNGQCRVVSGDAATVLDQCLLAGGAQEPTQRIRGFRAIHLLSAQFNWAIAPDGERTREPGWLYQGKLMKWIP